MTKNAQQALKYLIQESNENIRFCLICNYISKVETCLQNDFIKLRFKINNKDQYLGLDFHKKNIFSEKIFMSILSRYQVNQNSFSYIERQNYYKEILNYFYCFLLENKISKIVFYDYPHHIDSYILYVLSKHLNLKIIITSYLFLLGNYRLVFDDSLKNRFHQFKKNQVYKVEKIK